MSPRGAKVDGAPDPSGFCLLYFPPVYGFALLKSK